MSTATAKTSNWPLYVIGGLFAVAILGLIAWNVRLPYKAYSAGPVADAADAVIAEGVEVYPPKGELVMLTVVGQDVNIFEALIAGLDPTVELERRSARIREGETDEEYRNRVLQQMDDSNYRSIAVAMGYLGYELVPVEVVINEFIPGVPAESVLELGDTILSVNGMSITSVNDIRPLIEGLSIGHVVEMTIDRDGEILEVEVELAERDDEPGVAMIGVVLGELTVPPFPVSIDAGDVGGPSAGMMHTLAIIDTLTPGELTKGRVVAGTGTIKIDGTVGNIGFIREKVVGAEAAGATYILVPDGNYEAALTARHDFIEIVPISDIAEAVEFLESLPAA